MDALRRLVRYYATSALLRAADPIDFQRRYLRGLAVQRQLHAPKRTAKVLRLRRKA